MRKIAVATGLLFFGNGLNYLTDPGARLDDSPALKFASSIANYQAWGILFLGAGLFILVTLNPERDSRGYGLILGALCMLIWACVFIGGAIRGNVSFSAWMWPAYATFVAIHTYRELRKENKECSSTR